jgi:hypothetical protein
VNPRAPIYIVSKGRFEKRLTSETLHEMSVPHFIVVEEQEFDSYAARVASSATLLVLDKKYQREYDTFDDLGDSKSKGPGPARNFAWEHSIATGATWHWVMDDNIDGFARLNDNMKISVGTGTIFRVMEDFCARYENVLMGGPHYLQFVKRKQLVPPYYLNSRIYSCNLIRNDAPYRWRGRYNEDTDLSLRMMKDGYATILFAAFLQGKKTTQLLGGGNTKEFYAHEGTKPKSEMMVKMHPDVCRLTQRFGRIHHHCDYSTFRRQKLIRRRDVELPADAVDEYGMVLRSDGRFAQPIELLEPVVSAAAGDVDAAMRLDENDDD